MKGGTTMRGWLAELRSSVLAVAVLGVMVGGAYPLVCWSVAQILFPGRSNGSLVTRDGRIVGSSLIGEPFRSPAYFHPRPSAAGDGYDAERSGGTNLGPLSKALAESVRARAMTYREDNGLAADEAVPADAVTASGSGLDPHISPENARLQARRVARHRGLAEADVMSLVKACTEGRTFGVLGEPRVNVLLLNLSLDGVRDAGK
jgi:K+-transporting ATPase ATPase C chain